MTIPAPSPPARDPLGWLNDQPYLLLSLTSLFWAGNIVLGRYVAGHVPPLTLSCVRWIGAFLILLPFAWGHLKRDWLVLRAHLALMVVLSADGVCHQQRAVILGSATHPGAERAIDPVVGTVVRGAVVAAAVWAAADMGTARRHRHLACGRADHRPARRFCRARRYPIQQGRRNVRRGATGVRTLFGTDAAPAENAPAVADFLHHRLRRAAAVAVLDLGVLDRLYAEVRRVDDRDPDLCRDLSLHAGLFVLQPRHRADRSEPRRAVLPSGAGFRLGDGDPAARRAAAAVSSRWLCAGAGGRGDRVAAGLGGGVGPRVPDAVQRCYAAPQSRDPLLRKRDGPWTSSAPHRKRGALRSIRETLRRSI